MLSDGTSSKTMISLITAFLGLFHHFTLFYFLKGTNTGREIEYCQDVISLEHINVIIHVK